MARSSITPIDLAQKYLSQICTDTLSIQRALMPSLFNSGILCKKMATHNLVPGNKSGNAFTQTHIHIDKAFWNSLFTSAQISSYLSTRTNNQSSVQEIRVFESNIAALFNRRVKKLSSAVVARSLIHTYNLNTPSILTTYTTKQFNTQGSGVQVHIGIQDDDIFKDFRLGILLNDYLILLKYANSDSILAIAVPSEFASRYTLTGTSRINRKPSADTLKVRKEYTLNDTEYSTEANTDITSEITPMKPLPAPSGLKRNASFKVKYKGKPSRGKGALSKAGYVCECVPSHTSFISQKTGQMYMEPHHLIPISNQNLYSNDIDITPNLVCLCPNCHKQIHHGTKSDIKKMLTAFYHTRKNDLKTCGIDSDLNTLLAYYDIY